MAEPTDQLIVSTTPIEGFVDSSGLDSKYDSAWFEENRHLFLYAIAIFTREPLLTFQKYIEDCQSGTMTVNELLIFIDPNENRGVQGRSLIENLGYVLKENIEMFLSIRGLPEEVASDMYMEIDNRRLELYEVAGAPNPNIVVPGKEIYFEPKVESRSDPDGPDPIERYYRAVEKLFQFVEDSYDGGEIEDLIALLSYRVAEYSYGLKHEIGRGGGVATPDFLEYLGKHIDLEEKTIARLKKKMSEQVGL